ncbi:MAG: hypothetical protein ACRC2H_05640 [Silanimonas sp.]
MSNPCDDLSIGINVVTAQRDVVGAMSLSSISASDASEVGVSHSVASEISAGIATVQSFGILVSEAITASVATVNPLLAASLAVSRSRASGVLSAVFFNNVSSALSAADSTQHAVGNLVLSAMRAADAALQSATLSSAISSAAVASAIARQVLSQTAASSALASSAVAGTSLASSVVTSAARLSDQVRHLAPTADVIVSAIRAAVSRTDALDAAQVAVSEAFALDSLFSPTGAGWSAPSETWAMSRYAGIPGHRIAVIGGRAYIGGEDGLFVLDGQSDDGVAIAASADLGVTDMGSPQRKHLSFAYAAGKIVGALRAGVGDRELGIEQVWQYPFDSVSAPDGITTRAKLGRGHSAYEYRFTLSNQSGASFVVDDLRILFEKMSKKV